MKKVFAILLLLSSVFPSFAMEKGFRVDAKKKHEREQKEKHREKFEALDLCSLAHRSGAVLHGDGEATLRAIVREAVFKHRLDMSEKSCHASFSIPRSLRTKAAFGLVASLLLVSSMALPMGEPQWKAQADENARMAAQAHAHFMQAAQFAAAEADRQAAMQAENARKEELARKDREIAELKERLEKLEAKANKKDL